MTWPHHPITWPHYPRASSGPPGAIMLGHDGQRALRFVWIGGIGWSRLGPRRAGPVAQLDRASPSEGEGRTFESCRVRQYFRSGPVFSIRHGASASSDGVGVYRRAMRTRSVRRRSGASLMPMARLPLLPVARRWISICQRVGAPPQCVTACRDASARAWFRCRYMGLCGRAPDGLDGPVRMRHRKLSANCRTDRGDTSSKATSGGGCKLFIMVFSRVIWPDGTLAGAQSAV